MEIIKNIKTKKIILFITILLSFLLFEIIYLFIGIDFNNLSYSDNIKLILIKDVFFTMLLILLYFKYLKEKIKDFFHNFKKYLSISFKDWLTGFMIMIISNIFINLFMTGLGENENEVQQLISTLPIIAFIMTTFFAPFVEEMIFRKSLQDCFKNKYLFMIISGLLFGLVHVLGSTNPYEYLLIIPYGALGFMFAHTLSKTDNIFCTIMMHMFHNGLLTLLAIL